MFYFLTPFHREILYLFLHYIYLMVVVAKYITEEDFINQKIIRLEFYYF